MNWKDLWKWQEIAVKEMHQVALSEVKWKDCPGKLKFKLKLMSFISDYFTFDAVKSGWEMPRLAFKRLILHIKHPYLKCLREEK